MDYPDVVLESGEGGERRCQGRAGTFYLDAAQGNFTLTASLENNTETGVGTNTIWDGKTLTKTGGGTLTLSGTNSYTEGTKIEEGTLLVGNSQALGSGTVFMADNTRLGFVGNYTLQNAFTLGSGVSFDTSSPLVTTGAGIAGVIEGSDGLTKIGQNTLIFGGNNLYTGVTAIADNGGILRVTGLLGMTDATTGEYVNEITIGASGQFAFANADANVTQTLSGKISSAGSLAKAGASTLILTSTDNAYTGGTTVSGGILKGTTGTLLGNISVGSGARVVFEQDQDGSYTSVLSCNGQVFIDASGKTLSFTNANTWKGGATIGDGTTAVFSHQNNFGSGGFTIGENATLRITGSLGFTVYQQVETYPGNIVIGTGGVLDFAQAYYLTLTGQISGEGALKKSGAQTLVLTKSHTHAGDTTVSAGALTLSENASITSSAGKFSVANNATLNLSQNAKVALTNASVMVGEDAFSLSNATATLVKGASINLASGDFSMSNNALLDLTSSASVATDGTFEMDSSSRIYLRLNETPASAVISAATIDIQDGAILDLFRNAVNDPTAEYKILMSASGTGLTEHGDSPLILQIGGIPYDPATSPLSLDLVVEKGNGSELFLVLKNAIMGWYDTRNDSAHGYYTIGSGGRYVEGMALVDREASESDAFREEDIGNGIAAWDGTALTKLGAGTLVLAGENTYTGGTTIQAGTLQGNIPVGGDLLITAGAYDGRDENGTRQARVIGELTGSGVITNTAGLSIASGDYAGNIDNGNNTSFDNNGNPLATGLSLTKTGSGALILRGQSTYVGKTKVEGGVLEIIGTLAGGAYAGEIEIGENALLSLALPGTGATQTLSGKITGAGSLTRSGKASVMTLSNPANDYLGATTILSNSLLQGHIGHGDLTIESGAIYSGYYSGIQPSVGALTGGGMIQSTAGLTVTGGGTFAGTIDNSNGWLKVEGKTGAEVLTLTGVNNAWTGGTTITAGTLSIGSDSNIGNGTNTLSGGTLKLTGASHGKGWTLNSGATNTIENADAVSFGGVLSGDGGFTKTGDGTLTLTNANTYQGDTFISEGDLTVSGTLGNGSYVGKIEIADGSTLSFTQTTAQLLTSDGGITGKGDLIQDSAGQTLTLAGTNTHTGETTINAGTLKITGTLDSDGDAGYDYGGKITNAGALIFDQDSEDQTLSSDITGAGSLTQEGDNVLTLSGDNATAYTGAITVTAGTLAIGENRNLGTGETTLSGGALRLAANATAYTKNWTLADKDGNQIEVTSDTATLEGILSNAGGFTKIGGGILILTGTNNYVGGTTIGAGTLSIGADDNIGGGIPWTAGHCGSPARLPIPRAGRWPTSPATRSRSRTERPRRSKVISPARTACSPRSARAR